MWLTDKQIKDIEKLTGLKMNTIHTHIPIKTTSFNDKDNDIHYYNELIVWTAGLDELGIEYSYYNGFESYPCILPTKWLIPLGKILERKENEQKRD